ncbi:MAG: hypothetical protein JNM18_15130 [Planctomycetaceae bacterium]|nr:hypothetical protein [Planctomycetaceae bacterium]
MNLPEKVCLTNCATGTTELGRIATLTREDAKTGIDQTWWVDLENPLRDPADEVDRHWEWRAILSRSQNSPYFRARCIRTNDDKVQAAMTFRLDAKSALEADKHAVFIDRLATAPRNRDMLVETPLFRGSGTGLLVFAVAQSYSLGFGGRVNLFPVANQTFYEQRGFRPTAENEGGETLFELPSAEAIQLLTSKGLIDE